VLLSTFDTNKLLCIDKICWEAASVQKFMSTFMSTASLSTLPTELYSAILSHLPISSLQHTVLSLTRAIPYSPIPLSKLFSHIRLTSSVQLVQLHFRLCNDTSACSWVEEFELKAWSVDAEVAVSVVRLVNSVRRLRLCIGPSFAPEHLEEMFATPFEKLKLLALRFNP
jgi:hypothetical protein